MLRISRGNREENRMTAAEVVFPDSTGWGALHRERSASVFFEDHHEKNR
jgi:hypothetical protein